MMAMSTSGRIAACTAACAFPSVSTTAPSSNASTTAGVTPTATPAALTSQRTPPTPQRAPSAIACIPCREKYGLVFVGEYAQQAPDPLADFPEAQPLCLRALPVNSSLNPLYELLASYYAFADETPAGCIQLDDHTIGHRSAKGELLVFCIQPVDSDRHVIRGLISGQNDASAAERLALLRWHNQQLNELRARCEAQAVRKRRHRRKSS